MSMDILFAVPYVPNPIRVRPFHLIRGLLRRGHRVTVATLWATPAERADLAALRAAGAAVIAHRLPRWRSLWNCLRALPTGAPLQAAFCWHPALAREIAARQRGGRHDLLHVEHLRGARLALAAAAVPGPPIVWDSVDCISALFAQAATQSRSRAGRLMARAELPRTRRHEGWLLGQFARVLVTSPTDRDALLALATDAAPITVLPNGVESDDVAPGDGGRDPATLVITGKMSYHANVTAALHLVTDIMPLVWAVRPEVRVEIAGKEPPPTLRALAADHRVTVTGTVPDLRPYLRRATIAVAPVPYGVGIQNKTLEAMASGAPVVASPQASAALTAQPGRDLEIAASPEAFAATLLALLADPARRARLGAAGRAYVVRHHSWDAIVAALESSYAAALATPARRPTAHPAAPHPLPHPR